MHRGVDSSRLYVQLCECVVWRLVTFLLMKEKKQKCFFVEEKEISCSRSKSVMHEATQLRLSCPQCVEVTANREEELAGRKWRNEQGSL